MKQEIDKKIMFVIMITAIILIPVYNINNNKNTQIDKRINETNRKQFAMYIEDGEGSREYTESDTFPVGYKLNLDKSKCEDMNGNKEDASKILSSNGNSVTVKSNKTVYCTLYFEKPLITYIRRSDKKGTLSKNIVADMYRYQGVASETAVDENHKYVDNNYICFGTEDAEECKQDEDKYMYRIIGITPQEEIKIIKMKAVEEDNNNGFYWWSNYNDEIEWSQSMLYKQLNGEYENIDAATGEINTFVNSTSYPYMTKNSDWYNIIQDHNWIYGDIGNMITSSTVGGETVYGPGNNGIIIYEIETGQRLTQHSEKTDTNWKIVQYRWRKNISAKIGLMYLHDYYLAYDNERNWLSYQNTDYDKNNWIHINNNKNTTGKNTEWTMTHMGAYVDSGLYCSYKINENGSVDHEWFVHGMYLVRPVFYLSPDITINSGSGMISNPFIIKIN